MRIARAGRLAALIAAATAVACGPARDDGGTTDSSPGQAGPAVPPASGATAAATPAPAPAPIVPDTTPRGATTAARRTGVKSPGDTSEYDRAIEYKPDPKKELPAVGEKRKP